MAEPILEEGDPLAQYLSESGDTSSTFIPGSFAEDDDRPVIPNIHIFPLLSNIFRPRRRGKPNTRPHPAHPSSFAERFKYDVISSSLLSSSLSGLRSRPVTPVPARTHVRVPAIPGTLDSDTKHSRANSPSPLRDHTPNYGLVLPLTFAVSVSVGIFSVGYALVAAISLAFALALVLSGRMKEVLWIWGNQFTSKGVGEGDDVGEHGVIRPTLQALHDLISAGNIWDSVVHEAICILENEERSTYPTPAPSPYPPSPSKKPLNITPSPYTHTHPPHTPTQTPKTSLRTSLHTSLHTTQSQLDNIRALLSALTLPEEVSQLSEMYAPPSPSFSAPSFSLSPPYSPTSVQSSGAGGGRRPLSLPGSRRVRPLSLSPVNSGSDGGGGGKRATWNGTYSALAMAGTSPNTAVLKRRERRREELEGVLGSESGERKRGRGSGRAGGGGGGGSSSDGGDSVPVTPISMLAEVEEEGGVVRDGETMQEEEQKRESEVHFGTEALGLWRKRRNDGLGVFGIPSSLSHSHHHPRHSPTPSTPRHPPLPTSAPAIPTSTTFSPGSRFTTLQTNKHHPLSLPALHHALQNALASKRYACSHLLALRFEQEDVDCLDGGGAGDCGEGDGERDEEREREREGYWEDVRSVMGLLTGTLADAAARLGEALEDDEDMQMMREEEEEEEDPNASGGEFTSRVRNPRPVRSMAQMVSVSFAPMPSHLARFAAHVDAIASAMNEARENLELCVTSLREEDPTSSSHDGPHSRSGSGSGSRLTQEDPALLAYERLRRELGLALRECERGRERLLDLIAASNPNPESDDNNTDDDLPGLGHDVGSDESDKHDSGLPTILDFERGDLLAGGVAVRVVSGNNIMVGGGGGGDEEEGLIGDDATSHLLRMASSHHLPPQGIEQVFEAEPDPAGVGAFKRERSKLTREERISMAKARRDSGLGLSSDDGKPPSKPVQETWGPGGDVVQELKDVIWQVGERRRKMAEAGGGA